MRQFFLEIFGMFKKEKLYLFLLVSLLIFYGVMVAVHFRVSDKKEKPAKQTAQVVQGLSEKNLLDSKEIEKKLQARPELQKKAEMLTLATIAFFFVGFMLNLLVMQRILRRQEIVPRAGQALTISWGAADIVKVILLFVWVGVALNVAMSVAKFLVGNKSESFGFILLHTLAIDLLVVVFIGFVIRKSGATMKDVLGFSWRGSAIREIGLGVTAYITILPIVLGLLVGLIYVSNRLHYEPPPHPLVQVFLGEEAKSPRIMGLSLVLACLVGPVIEEIFFRGFLYPAVRKYGGIGWAMAISGGFFAALHENIFSFIPIFMLGLALCYLYEKRSSVLSCIALHVTHNSLFIAYFFLVKNLIT